MSKIWFHKLGEKKEAKGKNIPAEGRGKDELILPKEKLLNRQIYSTESRGVVAKKSDC